LRLDEAIPQSRVLSNKTIIEIFSIRMRPETVYLVEQVLQVMQQLSALVTVHRIRRRGKNISRKMNGADRKVISRPFPGKDK